MNQFPVFIDHRDSELEIVNQSLYIRQGEEPKQSLPLTLISQLVIFGKAQVTSDVWRHLAENQIPAVIFPGRGRGKPAFMGAGLSNSTHLRISQYKAFELTALREHYSLKLVFQKFQNQQATLNQLQIPILPESFPEAPMPLDKLLGLEGALARHYFSRIESYLDPKWEFYGRNRRPPKDPFNALISLSYTLLTSVMQQAIERAGLDVWLGIFHQPYPGRPSLAVDLMEPLRPQIDLWVIELLESYFNEADFTLSEQEGCRLNKEARKIYYQQWANLSAAFNDHQTLHQACFEYVNDFLIFLRIQSNTQAIHQDYASEAPF